MMRNRPFSRRRTLQFMVLLTLLAWATQTLFHQWGYGATPIAATHAGRTEHATLEIRQEAIATTADIHLRDVTRWSAIDGLTLSPLDKLVIAKIEPGEASRAVTASEIQSALRDAGVSLSSVHISGSLSCMVIRDPQRYRDEMMLAQWAQQAHPGGSGSTPTAVPRISASSIEQQLHPPLAPPEFVVLPGQFLTVTLVVGNMQVQTVGRAMDEGRFGSTIRVRNEATSEVYSVTLTGQDAGLARFAVASVDW